MRRAERRGHGQQGSTIRDHRGTWRFERAGRVPAALVRHEPGRFRRWHPDEHGDRRAGSLG
jgi:hypothetical protein